MSVFRKAFLIACIVLNIYPLAAQEAERQDKDPWADILAAMGKGDAGALAIHFSSMVDLGLPEKDDSYSRSQGEIIMRDFFKKCPPVRFEEVKKGRISDNSLFSICNYVTEKASYQVSIHLHSENNSFLVTKIKFEKQDI